MTDEEWMMLLDQMGDAKGNEGKKKRRMKLTLRVEQVSSRMSMRE